MWKNSSQGCASRVREYDPHIVALTAKHSAACGGRNRTMVREAPKAIVVVGGPQLSIYPEESLSWECFDIAVVGDGEETLLEICERIQSGSDWTDILGTCARLPDGSVRRNPARPLSKNINKYPMAAWDLMTVKDYHCLTLLKPFATMVTTRGCPWHCGYCSQVYSEKLRFQEGTGC